MRDDAGFCQLCDGTGLVEGRAAGSKPSQIRAAIAAGAEFCNCRAGRVAKRTHDACESPAPPPGAGRRADPDRRQESQSRPGHIEAGGPASAEGAGKPSETAAPDAGAGGGDPRPGRVKLGEGRPKWNERRAAMQAAAAAGGDQAPVEIKRRVEPESAGAGADCETPQQTAGRPRWLFAPRKAVSAEGLMRRARVDQFIRRMNESLPARIRRSDIWRVGGCREKTLFLRWQRGVRLTNGSIDRFERVLRMQPEAFWKRLMMIRGQQKKKIPRCPLLVDVRVLLSTTDLTQNSFQELILNQSSKTSINALIHLQFSGNRRSGRGNGQRLGEFEITDLGEIGAVLKNMLQPLQPASLTVQKLRAGGVDGE